MLRSDPAPVASVVRTPVVMEVNLVLPVKTVPEFIAYAKANPGKVDMATVGPGSPQHLYGEYFKMMTGIDMVAVHYRGAGHAITDLIAGRVQVMFDIVVSSLVLHQGRPDPALAVATATPQDVLPGVPTVGEFVPGYEASGWQGVCAPARRRPKSSRSSIAKSMRGSPTPNQSPARRARRPTLPRHAGRFRQVHRVQTDKWGKVVRKERSG